jgi:hypothetical protein
MSPCIALSGGLKKGQISAYREAMIDYAVSIWRLGKEGAYGGQKKRFGCTAFDAERS